MFRASAAGGGGRGRDDRGPRGRRGRRRPSRRSRAAAAAGAGRRGRASRKRSDKTAAAPVRDVDRRGVRARRAAVAPAPTRLALADAEWRALEARASSRKRSRRRCARADWNESCRQLGAGISSSWATSRASPAEPSTPRCAYRSALRRFPERRPRGLRPGPSRLRPAQELRGRGELLPSYVQTFPERAARRARPPVFCWSRGIKAGRQCRGTRRRRRSTYARSRTDRTPSWHATPSVTDPSACCRADRRGHRRRLARRARGRAGRDHRQRQRDRRRQADIAAARRAAGGDGGRSAGRAPGGRAGGAGARRVARRRSIRSSPIEDLVRQALAGGARGVVVADGRRTEFWVAEEGSDRIAMRQELEIENSPAMESVLSLRTVEFLRVSLGLVGRAAHAARRRAAVVPAPEERGHARRASA